MRALEKIITEMGMQEALPFLKDANLRVSSLRFMRESDLAELIPPTRIREAFRQKLLEWQILNWIPDELTQKPVLNKSLFSLLLESARGKNILARFKMNGGLTFQDRTDFISLMVDDILARNIRIRTGDFRLLVDEICELFPCEEDMRDFYFIERRQSGGNPSGKLYSKYKNMRYRKGAKRVKFNDPKENSAPQSSSDVSLDNLIKQEQQEEEDSDNFFDLESIQNKLYVELDDTRTSKDDTPGSRANATPIKSTQKDIPENPIYFEQIIKEEEEFTENPFVSKSLQNDHDFTLDDSRSSKDVTFESWLVAEPRKTTKKDAPGKPTESSSPVFNNNEADLKAIAGEIRSLNETTKEAKESILAMGSRICLLLEKGLEERQKHNALLAKLLEKNFKE